MPVILATQQAEIRRIKVQSQPGQIVHETLTQKKPYHKTKTNKQTNAGTDGSHLQS
jgi:hypothetical protein